MKIITIYDNNLYDERLRTGWGFSCIVDGNILFDTGGDGPTLLYNMKMLGIDPKEIDIVVLSHEHWDHIGGLFDFLEENSDVSLFIPKSFSSGLKSNIKQYSTIIEVKESKKIRDNIYTTGELGRIKEQSLIVKTKRGLTVITGCAHPGVVNIIEHVREIFDEEMYMVIGGLHLGNKDVTKEFRRVKVKRVAACHCTGNRAIELLRKEYKENFIENGVGGVIELE
jgi:7,8-dihydropterin-6-yl-methyl-4-(beta-D-ribofuranosyl)aminobenzene 5'-phosphate synthase